MKKYIILILLITVGISFACTNWLASGRVTVDGRPILHKNRDVGNDRQEYHYVENGGIPFIGQTYANLLNGEYWAGTNAAGFAIQNSNSYNMEAPVFENGWGAGADDGWVQAHALSTCRTVDDFEALLDSLNEGGRTHNSNYGVIDAFGGAALFETAGQHFARHDADDAPDGFIVRSNYSYAGDGVDNRQAFWGPHRHDRAYELMKEAVDNNELSVEYMFRHIVRDLATVDHNPYENGFVNNLEPIGSGLNRINRSTTRTVVIIQGVEANGNPLDATMWVMSGNQIGSIALPLWVRAGSVPEEIDGETGSRMCDLARDISAWVTENSMINSQKLVNADGTGYWDFAFPIEDEVFSRTNAFLESQRFDYDQLEGFQNAMARTVTDQIEAWQPHYETAERAELSGGLRGETYKPRNGEFSELNKGVIKTPEHNLLSVVSVSNSMQLNNLVRSSTHIFDIMGRRVSKGSVPYLPDGNYYFIINNNVQKILIMQ